MGVIGKRVAYYPGCSLEGAARAYDVSTRIVARELGLELDYLEDYNCCGAMESKNITFMGTLAFERSEHVFGKKARARCDRGTLQRMFLLPAEGRILLANGQQNL
jgi:hypothetical protein